MSGQCPVGPDDLDGGEVALNRAYEEEAVSEKPPDAFVKFLKDHQRFASWETLAPLWRAAQAEAYEKAAKIAEDDDFAHKLDNIDRDLGAAIAAAIRERAKEER